MFEDPLQQQSNWHWFQPPLPSGHETPRPAAAEAHALLCSAGSVATWFQLYFISTLIELPI